MQIESHPSAAASAFRRALDVNQLLAETTIASVTAGRSAALRSPAAVPSVTPGPPAEPNAAPGPTGSAPNPDTVSISPEARALQAAAADAAPNAEPASDPGAAAPQDAPAGTAAPEDTAGPANEPELSPEEQAQVKELQQRDAEVRAHENAHASAGGGLAGSPQYTYQPGPDGRLYAVGGEVPIEVRSGSTPEETLRNASQVRAAALAPSQPSSADLGVAAAATALEMEARRELAEERAAEEASATTDRAAETERESSDPRSRDYGQVPTAAVDVPLRIDLFG